MVEDSLFKRYTYKMVTNLSNAILGIITMLFVPKVLGPAQYGQFDFISNHFTELIKTCLVSTPEGFFNWVSKKGKNEDLNGPLRVVILLFTLVTVLILVFLLTASNLGWQNNLWPEIPVHVLYSGLFFGGVTSLFTIFTHLADGLAETVFLEIVRISMIILRTVIILALIYFSALTLMSYFWLQNILIFGAVVFLILFFIQKGFINRTIYGKFDRTNDKRFINFIRGYSTPLLAYTIVGFLISFLDRWLLQLFHGSVEQGYYSVGLRFSSLAILFTSAMSPLLFREMSLADENKDMLLLNKLFDRIQVFFFIAATICIYLATNTDLLIEFLGAKEYSAASASLFLMAVYPIHQTFGQLSSSLLLATGQSKKYATLGLTLMIGGVPLTFLLIAPTDYFIPGLGLTASGLAIKMVIWQVIGTNIFLFYNCKYLGSSFSRWLMIQLKILIPLIIFAYLSKLCAESSLQYFSPFISSGKTLMVPLFKALFSGLIFSILTVALLCLYPNVAGLHRSEIKSFLSKLKRK